MHSAGKSPPPFHDESAHSTEKTAIDRLLSRLLAFDIEVTKTGALRHLGAAFQDKTFEWTGEKAVRSALLNLDDFGADARYVLGHNIFSHDLPFLAGMAPELKMLSLPIIDTLYLSPLAFPQNPYHRLIKDYKLVRSSLSDPLEDVRLALSVFREQWESFAQQSENCPELLSFYRFCFQESRFGGFSGQGLSEVFRLLGAKPLSDAREFEEIFKRLAGKIVCHQAIGAVLAGILTTPALAPVAAFSLAWLRVAGANSVLPPWVRHQFPAVVPFLKKLRDIPCGDPTCPYCNETHDPDAQLNRFFGFDQFRPEPETGDGQSLQRAVVLTGLQDTPLLAILPTGGGKSLCYQLPALVRHLRRGLLTVVISPLQALMKDQIDNLVRMTGTPFAAAIYGLLTPPERGEVMERVRMGDVAILYLSPEQLRGSSIRKMLEQREIGCWVFDEAHCLSKWGHDFRPDYLYAARFIREFAEAQQLPLPPIACYTATAKPDVIEEITAYFQSELHQRLLLFAGGVERPNLSFDILPVSAPQKPEHAFDLLCRHIGGHPPGCAIVYAAKRRTTEEIRDYLIHRGLSAEAFHAGLDANEKRRIMDEFAAGRIPVICATNAFGMGIDKNDIRLVLHYDIPGSLENYLQEAGRAGRDLKPAHCILLYDPEDAEAQFKLGAVSEISKEEIQRILRCLKRGKRNRENDIVITTQELLRDEELSEVFEKSDPVTDTKIKTAVSWLERAGFLQRNQNLTQVFQGKPIVKTLAEAETIINRLKISPLVRKLWRGILGQLFNAPGDRGLSADDIAESLFSSVDEMKLLERQFGLTPSQIVIQAMHEMAEARLLDKGMMLTAFLRYRGKNNALKLFDYVVNLEERFLKLLGEEAPDADTGTWVDLDINAANQRLQADGDTSNPVTLRALIKGLVFDGKGLAGSHGSIELKHVDRNRYRVSLQRNWIALRETAALRRNVARVLLLHLLAKAKKASPEGTAESPTEALVEFGTNELSDAIRHDLLLHAKVQKPLAAIDRALMFLHEHKIIALQSGLAVFRQALTIRLNPKDAKRQYTVGDYKPLAVHYRERRFQVHVIMEYATLAMDKIARALTLVLDYFALPREHFVKKYFSDREEILQRATGIESYRRIVESLRNPIQIEIVGSPVHANRLILAGPGAGKTRVVVHRCAYLLRVERIPANRILVICFNHSAAVSLRKRLKDLVGPDALGVTVATYHGAAMRLAGISPRELMEARGTEGIDFDGLIADAVSLLKGEKEIPGMSADELRDQLLQGFSHILVDEYQDIDTDQYELVSAIAGRTLSEGEGKLSILAVGDDDQSIYGFRGANVEFLKRFQEDYKARPVYMVENYRATDHIIQAANNLIRHNRDRLKGDHPIRVNRERSADPAGGPWEQLDPLGQGRVQVLTVKDRAHQAAAVFNEISRLKSLDPGPDWSAVAVLARTHDALHPLRSVFEERGIPVQRSLTTGLPLHRIREVHRFLTDLKAIETEIRSASQLENLLPPSPSEGGETPWYQLLSDLWTAYREETADTRLPVGFLIDRLYEGLADQRREKTLGRGVFLNTVHGAKGLEFDHVFILDGDWHLPKAIDKQEEERRLLYVGMTRARSSLCLLEMEERRNPFIRELTGNAILRRRGATDGQLPADILNRRYAMIGLKDIYLGYAGGFDPDHPIHPKLTALSCGDPVTLVANGTYIDVCASDGVRIARLSKEGKRLWADRLGDIEAGRILGMLYWAAKDSDPLYKDRFKADSWEVPLIEVVLKGASCSAINRLWQLL
ncbi:MAG: RecQ family ATP-dependent DNA helicase [Desulfobacterales bacterium]|nr:RecQ family ATP-dependent DNA helicase [Desulfobacterales bacterium]